MNDTKNSRPATGHLAPFGLRLQPDLKQRLMDSANQSGRSLNAELVARLEASYANTPDDKYRELVASFSESMERITSLQQKRLQTERALLEADVRVLEYIIKTFEYEHPFSPELRAAADEALAQLRKDIADTNDFASSQTEQLTQMRELLK